MDRKLVFRKSTMHELAANDEWIVTWIACKHEEPRLIRAFVIQNNPFPNGIGALTSIREVNPAGLQHPKLKLP